MPRFGGFPRLDAGDSINAGRVGAWNLANPGGVTLDASVGNANGIWSGPVAPLTGPYGQALRFDSTNNYSTVPHRGIHDNTNAFSYAVCSYVISGGSGALGFFIDRGGSSGHWGLFSDGATAVKSIRMSSVNYSFGWRTCINHSRRSGFVIHWADYSRSENGPCASV